MGTLESDDGKHIEGIQELFLKIYTSYKEGLDFMVGHLGDYRCDMQLLTLYVVGSALGVI